VAFPEVFIGVKADMENVMNRLRKTGLGASSVYKPDEDIGVGRVTQSIEQDIIDTLGEMIEALKKQQQQMQDKKQQKPGQSQKQDQKLIDLLAELKMVRSMQIRINNRTKTYANEYPDAEQLPTADPAKSPEEREKADLLYKEHLNLAE